MMQNIVIFWLYVQGDDSRLSVWCAALQLQREVERQAVFVESMCVMTMKQVQMCVCVCLRYIKCYNSSYCRPIREWRNISMENWHSQLIICTEKISNILLSNCLICASWEENSYSGCGCLFSDQQQACIWSQQNQYVGVFCLRLHLPHTVNMYKRRCSLIVLYQLPPLSPLHKYISMQTHGSRPALWWKEVILIAFV